MKELKLLSLVLVAGTATLFTACTTESDNSPSAKISYETVAAAQQVPVTFGSYLGEQAITRFGSGGSITSYATLNAKGFGVFAYYTQNDVYSASATPNFMYNQSVQFTDTDGDSTPDAWTYSPIKYWPNDYNSTGAVDQQTSPATGSASDKLSFFAYAPYEASGANGTPSGTSTRESSTEVGICAFTGNSATGDPKVTYAARRANTISNAVDLLWGVAVTGGLSYTTANNGTQNVPAGMPLISLVKPTTGTAITFAFNHALAGLNLTAAAKFNNGSYTTIPDETFIHIDEVVISSSNLNDTGILNLNNTSTGVNVPNWDVSGASNVLPTTTFTLSNGDISSYLRYTDVGSTVANIKNGVGRESTTAAAKTTTPQQVIDGNVSEGEVSKSKVFTMIPTAVTGEDKITFDVTVTYYVRTKDPALVKGYSSVKNKIKKSVSFGDPGLAGNKIYTINMILGLEDVTLTGTVEPWGDGSTQSVYLPENS